MRVQLDKSKCVGHALCYGVSAELFPVDDSGYSTLEPNTVPAGAEEAVREGVAACPESALAIEP